MLALEAPTTLNIVVESRESLDRLLDAAVESLKPAALQSKTGIAVARTGIGMYTATVRDHVPFGAILELWEPAT
jgi:hypothetical protein